VVCGFDWRYPAELSGKSSTAVGDGNYTFLVTCGTISLPAALAIGLFLGPKALTLAGVISLIHVPSRSQEVYSLLTVSFDMLLLTVNVEWEESTRASLGVIGVISGTSGPEVNFLRQPGELDPHTVMESPFHQSVWLVKIHFDIRRPASRKKSKVRKGRS
jgi:hypothetical protein